MPQYTPTTVAPDFSGLIPTLLGSVNAVDQIRNARAAAAEQDAIRAQRIAATNALNRLNTARNSGLLGQVPTELELAGLQNLLSRGAVQGDINRQPLTQETANAVALINNQRAGNNVNSLADILATDSAMAENERLKAQATTDVNRAFLGDTTMLDASNKLRGLKATSDALESDPDLSLLPMRLQQAQITGLGLQNREATAKLDATTRTNLDQVLAEAKAAGAKFEAANQGLTRRDQALIEARDDTGEKEAKKRVATAAAAIGLPYETAEKLVASDAILGSQILSKLSPNPLTRMTPVPNLSDRARLSKVLTPEELVLWDSVLSGKSAPKSSGVDTSKSQSNVRKFVFKNGKLVKE